MKHKKGMEMTISTIVVLVLALILIAIGLFLTYKYILKPSESAGSVITCEARGGTTGADRSVCTGCPVCLTLYSEEAKKDQYCCIKEIK